MQVEKNISLKSYNTFGIDVKTHYFIEIKTESELKGAIDFKNDNKLNFLILGGGSNVLFTKDYDGVIFLNRMKGREIVHEDEAKVLLKVKGGEDWPQLVDYCVSRNWGGIENLSLIPGRVGAAPVQNIGAYGTEVKQAVVEVEAMDLQTGEIRVFTKDECGFGYRSSIFKTGGKGNYFITAVTLGLMKNPAVNLSYAPLREIFKGRDVLDVSVKEVSEAVKQVRRSKLPDPRVIGNAGSFFKNPVVSLDKMNQLKENYPDIPVYPVDDSRFKLAAGWLIEQCGWKGKRVGDAGVHEKQALVLVNYGGAKGKDILKLATDINDSVKEDFGVLLEFEVNII